MSGRRPLAEPAPGALLGGRYQLVRQLGTGGMGAVYEVIDQSTNRRRALKLLHSRHLDAAARARFRREATVSGRVESDFVVEVVDAGFDAALEADFLVMELLRGRDLGAELDGAGPLSAAEVVRLLVQVALAMDKVHAEGVVHRDLKPENLFLTDKDDGSRSIKILDFGVAKVLDAGSGVHTTGALGTPMYMAPEQLTGDALVAESADLYALGHVAYTLLVGAPYWEQEFAAAGSLYPFIMTVVAGAQESPSARAARRSIELPAAFDGWFERATAKQPESRFSSATEQIRALAVALGVDRPDLFPVAINRAAPQLGKAAGRESVRAVVTSNQRSLSFALPRGRRNLALLAAVGAAAGAAWLYLSGPGAAPTAQPDPHAEAGDTGSQPASGKREQQQFPAALNSTPSAPASHAAPAHSATPRVDTTAKSAAKSTAKSPAEATDRSAPRTPTPAPSVPAGGKRATSSGDDSLRKQPAPPQPAYDPLDAL